MSSPTRDTTALDWAVLHNPTVVVMIGLLLRCSVGLHPHSGQGMNHAIGELEFHRRYIALANNESICDWYKGTDFNEIHSTGLVYPPVTLYLSWFWSHVARYMIPGLLTVEVSPEFDAEDTKAFMRATVLLLDIMLFIPAIWGFCIMYYGARGTSCEADEDLKDSVEQFVLYSTRGPESSSSKSPNKRRRGTEHSFSSGKLAIPVALVSEVFLLILLQPSWVLIDHGHFHYSNVYLGFLLWMLVFLMRGQYLLGAICFCLAINANQAAAACWPIVLPTLLKGTLSAPNENIYTRLGNLFKVITSIAITLGFIWWPLCVRVEGMTWYRCSNCADRWSTIISSLFPTRFDRSGSNMYDLIGGFLEPFDEPTRVKISVSLTIIGMLPSVLDILRKNKPISMRRILWALFNVSLTCYISYFNMHPRGILLPLLPAALLAGEAPGPSCWFGVATTFSLAPFLLEESLGIAYTVCTSVFVATCVICFRREICFLPLPWIETKSVYWPWRDYDTDCRYGIRMVNCEKPLRILVILCVSLNVGFVLSDDFSRPLWRKGHSIVSVGCFMIAWIYGNWYQLWIPEFEVGNNQEKSKVE